MDELVITPGGLRPRSMVHEVNPGVDVNLREGIVRAIDQKTKQFVELGPLDSEKAEKSVNRNLKRRQLTRTEFDFGLTARPITDRWIVYAGWMNQTNRPISFFSTKWEVPPPPATDNNQLIYIFNGIENSSFNLILQPVLQWGVSPAGGGSFWSVANWFVGTPDSGIAVHSPLTKVNPGDKLQGIMTLQNHSAGRFSYRSSFKGHPECDLSITDVEELKWANETLECYGFRKFSDYPDANETIMSDIEIRFGNDQANLQWEEHNDVTDNGQSCVIESNSSPTSRLSLHYRAPFA